MAFFSQLPGDAVYGNWSGKADENGETIRGQGAVSGLSDTEGSQG